MTDLQALTGLWKSQGQGVLLEINNNQYRLYDLTTISCIQTDQGAGDDFLSSVTSLRLSSDQQQLILIASGNVVDTHFSRLATLPDQCANGGMQTNHNPELNFEVFWHTFSENYPAFAKRGVDWQQIYQQYRPQVTAQTSDATLFSILGGMIAPLNDGHVQVTNADGESISSFTQGAYQRNLQREFEQQQLITDRQQYDGQAIAAHFNAIQNNYLHGPIKTGVLEQMFWGKTEDNFGYLYLGEFDFADKENDDANSTQAIAALRDSMAALIADVKNVKGLIIDLRFNPGGNDATTFEVASFFNDQDITVFSVQSAMPGQQLSLAVSANLPVAAGSRYVGPIALLTSSLTGSAAEIFTLALRELPHVTLVGGNTGGDLSNRLDKQLPNGWMFSVAPDVYRSQDGRVFEVEGIPPNAAVPFFSHTDRGLGIDSAIDTAQQILTLDKTILASMSSADIPAMSASLVVNGATMFSKGYGFADVEQQHRATADTPFGLASVSKTVIGVAIMQLVEQGRLSLDTPINSVLPFTIDNPKIEDEVITVRHLVSHTSSLIDNEDVYGDSFVLQTEPVLALGEMLRNYYLPDGEFYDAQLNFAETQPGGDHFQYSNIAAALAAYVVEVVAQQSFDQYVQQHVFNPLQMNNSHYFLEQFPANTVAIPYGLDNDGQFYHYPTYPDGMLRSSATDLAAYMADLTTDSQLLTPASVTRLWMPLLTQTPSLDISSSNIGVFWDVDTNNSVRTVGHGGSDPDVASELIIVPDLGVGAAVAINTDRDDDIDQPTEADQVLFNTTNRLLQIGAERAINQQSATEAGGSWYDPAVDGQGLHIEILPNNQAMVIWFGYDSQGQQLWTIGSGRVVGNRIDIPTAYQTTGGVFGANFNPAAVQRSPWGEMVFEFEQEDGETTATLIYNSKQAPQHGEISLTRLTRDYQPESSAAIHNITGTWFDPEHNGEGIIVQQLNETEALLYWLTYTPDGNQAWLIGNGQFDGDTFNFTDMQITTTSATTVERTKWGSIALTIDNCRHIEAQYQGLFGSGELMLQRLTTPVSVECQ
jgi:CubicO group peptidase (beta-lactamase class C family)